MFSEITQKNKLEILGKLTASLAHELRNPLSAIKLNLDYMQMDSDDLSDEFNESLQSCVEGVQRIELLIENILSFSRKARNKEDLVCLNTVTASAVSLVASKATKEQVKIKTNLTLDLPKINFDANNLLQVLLNLITNSIEACENKKGEINISTFVISDNGSQTVAWQIKDNGVGIKEEDYERIYSEFFTNKSKGTGLGLAVCKSILENNNAELNFESESGKGTTFTIVFDNNFDEE